MHIPVVLKEANHHLLAFDAKDEQVNRLLLYSATLEYSVHRGDIVAHQSIIGLFVVCDDKIPRLFIALLCLGIQSHRCGAIRINKNETMSIPVDSKVCLDAWQELF